MGEKIVVGPPGIPKGFRNDRPSFNFDNDSFPKLVNAYQWRGRIRRKRGTSLLGRCNRFIGTTDGSGNATITITPAPNTATSSQFVIGSDVFLDPGTASPVTLITNSSGSATLNRSTGVLTITGSQISTNIFYYPGLPVMGLEDLNLNPSSNPGTLAFDTDYAYNIQTSSPYNVYDVSYYKNPAASGSLPGYTQKTSSTHFNWNGQDYQQFWTTNYQGALWATNGITVPFTTTKIGMQYKSIVSVTVTSGGPPATAVLEINNHGLSVGDFLFINEVATTTGINFQTGYVIAPAIDANHVNVEFPTATIANAGTGGIAQYLTNTADSTKDCLRWYDGDPTTGSSPFGDGKTGVGWVNFCPPLSLGSYSIAELPAAQYYLVGARMIVSYKDRLLFIGPVIQTSGAGSQVYLQDTVIYSQNGTPYYTCTFPYSTVTPSSSVLATANPQSLLVPTNQTCTANAWFEDVTGYGGFITAGFSQAINTVGFNEDVLIMGFSNRQARFVYSGNDIVPFNFFVINSEFGSNSTFSSITLDRGVVTIGPRGIPLTTQVSSARIDPEIPDQIFQFNLTNNGTQRVCAQRDFINEWIYFTYPSNEIAYVYPNQTLLYNYRDNSWAIFNETYTTYGTFTKVTGYTWATLPSDLTWATWTDPWDSGDSTVLQPEVIAGNQQGFILFRETEQTTEGTSLFIQNIVSNTVTSPNHCLNNGDYITVSGVLGSLGSQINGKVFRISNTTTNSFVISPGVTGTYLGGGLITRMYRPEIQTKQFPTSWGMARKTRIGPQQYLLTKTNSAQITLQIFLSQDAANPYNFGPIVPNIDSDNDALIYSDILYTCLESVNIGLTAANANLQMIGNIDSGGTYASSPQAQIWHRMNTSLIGDTVQIGLTLSNDQMSDPNLNYQFAEIELHGFVLDVNPSQLLA